MKGCLLLHCPVGQHDSRCDRGRYTWFVPFDEEIPIDEDKVLETAQVRRCPSCQTFLTIRRVLLAPPS